MLEAVEYVLTNNVKIKQAARFYNLNYKTLGRYVKLKRDGKSNLSFGYRTPTTLSLEIEEQLVKYIKMASKIFFGITIKELRVLAYELAKANDIKMPKNWSEEEMAGIDWYKCFRRRHKDISLRTPEATSLGRMMCFNKHNVNEFYDNLQNLTENMGFTAERIYNCDETGVTTVHKPTKQLAARGAKRVGAATSHEKGTLVTVNCAVNAIGNRIPPFVVFPRVKTQEFWVDSLPPLSVAEGHPKASGWMTAENFSSFLKHFKKHSMPSKDSPVLLLLDNHASHVTIENIDYCCENNIHMLSFPPTLLT